MLIACLEKSKFVCYRQRGRREPVHRGGATNEMRRESPLTVLQIIQICLGNSQPRRRLPLRPAFGEPSRAEFVSFHMHVDNMIVIICQDRTNFRSWLRYRSKANPSRDQPLRALERARNTEYWEAGSQKYSGLS